VVGRLLIVGVAWLAALVLFAAMLQWSARPSYRPTPAPNALARELTSLSVDSEGAPEWAVTRAMSAHHAMVLEIEAVHPERARNIAAEVVAPLRDRYEEVLIYVRAVDTAADPVVRRIQWTPRGGYVEHDYKSIVD
jgi:hypothetical protein